MTAPGPFIELPPLQRTVLPNGLTLLVLERHALPLVTLRLLLRAGSSRDPQARPGLASFTARLLRHGAGARDGRRFATDLDALGGDFGTTVGWDHVSLDAEFTTGTLERGLDLFLSAVREPRFDADDVERERERAAAELVQARDEPDHLADDAFQQFLMRGHVYGSPPQGTLASLAQVTRDDVVGHHRETYTPRGGVLVAVGDVNGEDLAARLGSELGTWREDAPEAPEPSDPARIEGRRVVLVHHPGAEQVQYRTGNVGLPRRTEHWMALTLANCVLGGGFTSRLMQEVRVERGLTYGIGSRPFGGRAAGPFLISTFTRNEKLAELHEVVTGELRRLHAQGIDDAEAAAARRYLVGLQVRRVETPEALASAVAEAELFALGLESVTGFREELDRVTREDVARAIAAAVPRDDLLTVVVGDRDALAPVAQTLGRLEMVESDFAEPDSAGGGAGS